MTKIAKIVFMEPKIGIMDWASKPGSVLPEAVAKFKEAIDLHAPPEYGKWSDLNGIDPTLRRQLQLFRETFAVALTNANIDLPPFHIDFTDGKAKDALAFVYDGYSFIAVTIEIVLAFAKVSHDLSTSVFVTLFLSVHHLEEKYNPLQGVLVTVLLAFLVSHEFAHHKYGHALNFDAEVVTQSARMGSSMEQVDELFVDGLAIHLSLHHFVEQSHAARDVLSELRVYSQNSPEALMVLSIFVAIAGYFMSRPLQEPNVLKLYIQRHPLERARLYHLRKIALERFALLKRPDLELFLRNQFSLLVKTAARVILSGENLNVWDRQLTFMDSDQGRNYATSLTNHFDRERSKAIELGL